MTSCSISPIESLAFLFRRANPSDEGETKPVTDRADEADAAKIRCPLCKWHPKRDSFWVCWDCDHPEYFYSGCGMEWNTFETKGLCPGCSHQWIWTSCLQCFLWSKHEDWYE